ncbi:hypothetical protein AB0O91_16700 [Kitasatospora sp. NPDC089797]|uniref:PH domain-containing protein n=1 Tax=Kitasatospora sp. NPDC089797 TaxID=3155298 RepID=UPI0034121AD8
MDTTPPGDVAPPANTAPPAHTAPPGRVPPQGRPVPQGRPAPPAGTQPGGTRPGRPAPPFRPEPRSVRLAFLWRAAGAPVGCVLALAMGVVLAQTGVAGRLGAVPALLLSGTAVLGIALPVPYGFWLRADPDGLTLVRAFVPRRYRWQDIVGLTMEADEDPDSGAARLVLLLRLVPARTVRAARTARTVRTAGSASAERAARVHGPVLGILGTTPDGLPRGTEPRALAELFDLLRRHGVPLEDPRYADLVLIAHGYPALARPTATPAPAPGTAPASATAVAPGTAPASAPASARPGATRSPSA